MRKKRRNGEKGKKGRKKRTSFQVSCKADFYTKTAGPSVAEGWSHKAGCEVRKKKRAKKAKKRKKKKKKKG